VSAVFWSLGRQRGLCGDKGGHSDQTSIVRGTGSAERRSPETASSRTVTTRARDRQHRRQAATEDRAGVDDTMATDPPASGRREPSGVHRDRRDGYRPTGVGRASPEASEVDLGHSEHVRPDQTGSGRIGPDQTGSSQTDPKPAEVEPVDRHGVPDDRGYPSVGELQPTWTRERLA